MEKLIEKIDNLKNELDKNINITNIKKLNKLIEEDNELNRLLNEYKYNKNDNVKNSIINNKLFNEYKDNETEINILIMLINSKLKEINSKGKCNL